MNAKSLLVLTGALALQACVAAPRTSPQERPGSRLISGRTVVIAHRGGAGPDGTRACTDRSIAAGVTFLELDVRLTRDAEAVILHDPTVDRTTDGKGAVADLTLEEVRRLDAGSKYRDPAEPEKSFAGERIPTVKEMIHSVGARGVVLLELKVAAAAHAVIAAVSSEQAFNRVVVRSADKAVLRRIKEIDERIQIGTMGTLPEENFEAFLDELKSLGVVAFTAVSVERAQVEQFHRRGIAVWGSNTNDPAVMRKLIEAGVDGIITDSCPVLAELIKGQAQAPPEPAPPPEPEAMSLDMPLRLRTGLWTIPDFQATLPAGSREFTRGTLFDLGLDVALDLDPFFVQASTDYAISGQLTIFSGSLQAGVQTDLGELVVPLSLRGSVGVLFADLSVRESRFGDFDPGVGFLLRLELEGRLSESVTASLWLDYRQVEFDFKPTVIGGDRSAGGSTFAVGLSLGLRF